MRGVDGKRSGAKTPDLFFFRRGKDGVLIVDVTIEDADGKIKKERPLEMWEYAGGDWYWGYMGGTCRRTPLLCHDRSPDCP